MAVKRRKTRRTKVRAKTRRKAKTVKAKRRGGGGLSKLNYTLSPELAEIVGAKRATRPQVVKKLWSYIKHKRLQDTRNRRMINPDAKLSQVLGKQSIDMLKMAGAIGKHLKKA